MSMFDSLKSKLGIDTEADSYIDDTEDEIFAGGQGAPQQDYEQPEVKQHSNKVVNINATTQLQVVAAIRYITNGTYLAIMKEMLEAEVCDCMKPLQARVAKMVEQYEAAINAVKDAQNQEVHDFLGRRLYDMTAEIIMSLLIIEDASRAPELFKKSAHVYVRMAEENVLGKAAYIQNFKAEDLAAFRAVETETAE